MAYTSKDKIEDFLDRTLSSNESDLLTILIPAIQKYIDLKTGSHFDTVEEATRKYDGGCKELDIDPCQAVSAVKSIDEDGTVQYTYESDEYVLEPVNETVKRSLRKRYYDFPKGIANIQVTAKFTEYEFAEGEGSGKVPEDIQMIATRLAGTIINQSGEGAGIKSESLEGHSITYDTAGTVEAIASKDSIIKSTLELRRNIQVG